MMKQGRDTPARRVAVSGLLFSLALALSWLESLASPLLGLPPGLKIGLANTVVLFSLLFVSRRQALLLVALKAGFALLTRGAAAGMLSAAGGLLSLGVCCLLLLPKKSGSVVLLSVAGAVAHNVGQLATARFLFGASVLFYTPVLLMGGVVMGCLSAGVLRLLLPALQKGLSAGRPNGDVVEGLHRAGPAKRKTREGEMEN